jgi:hypothetical protein
MKYAVEMGSSVLIYIPSFRHSKVDRGGGDSETHRQNGNLISVLLYIFFQNKERSLKTPKRKIV